MIAHRAHRSNRGFSLIEIMIGIVIGFIAILVIYQVFALAEGNRRNTTSAGDAQQNGLFSSFMLGIELANSGNAIASAAQDLGTCPPGASSALTWRPIPVLINDGGAPDVPDSFVVAYSTSSALIAPAPFTVNALANEDYIVQSPTGFKLGDLIVAVSGSGACAASRATIVTVDNALLGTVRVKHTDPGVPGTFSSGSAVLFNMGSLNMGPAASAQKISYDISSNVLRSSVLLDNNGVPLDPPIPNPLASNVVNMKLQYGIVPAGGGPLQWKTADAFPWRPVDLLSGLPNTVLVPQLKTMKAVRIAMVVQGEQWDREAPDVTKKFFDDTLTLTFPRAGGGNYRYRFYETVIPLRNELWNGL